MRAVFLYIIVAFASCVLGISSAGYILDSGIQFGKVTFGPWDAWPSAGEPGSDPYSNALFARSGSVWLSNTEGLMLIANRDDSGQRLRPDCSYRLVGEIPRARLWTLSVEDAGTGDASRSSSLSSQDVIWREDKSLEVTISSQVTPWNWLPVEGDRTFNVILRLYDTPLTSGALEGVIEPPSIVRGACTNAVS